MGHFSLASGGYFYNFSKAVRFLKQPLRIDPILTRAISPLSAGEESIATFEIMSQEMCNEFIKSHIETREFWSYSSGILQDFDSRPATEIASKWLIDDLRELGWAERYH